MLDSFLDFRLPAGAARRTRSTSRTTEATCLPGQGAVPILARPTHRGLPILAAVLAFSIAFHPSAVSAADWDTCRERLVRGQYAECIQSAVEAMDERRYGEDWPVLKARAHLALGEYEAAQETVETGLKRYSSSVRLRMEGYTACLHSGDAEGASKRLEEINRLASRAAWRYTDSEDLVALGRAALILGADARAVLETFFDRAKKQNPKDREAYLASGELALDKHDPALAADIFRAAEKQFPDDPDVQFGLARAFETSEPERAAAALAKTLERNPRHVPAMLWKVDQFVDAEDYAAAESWIERVLAVNSRSPEAWAYRSVVAHLTNDPKGEAAYRLAALQSWARNPAVDHLIGRKLSQNYRFAEGAAAQRRALEFDADYLPAKIQLAQDLLRLGQEEEGWELARSAHKSDGYDVTTFNLVELGDELARFETLEDDHFIVRMEAHEAAVYGRRILDLLNRAKRTLCDKYGLDLTDKITVEIFPDENDFAVRTFGMPAISGYLGVCFGRVITANSPASQGEYPSNWESVLWHEFCHVVTLELTNNRIPRWLSEGISVYEELQEDPTWGQRMTPQYRRMILEGELTPITELSSAFHAPPSPQHLQFAYFQSELAVEFLVERYGREALKSILRDLGAGLPINAALERHTTAAPQLVEEFAAFVKQRAEGMAPNADWKQHDLAAVLNDDGDAFEDWLKEHPKNFPALMIRAQMLLGAEEWIEAEAVLLRLIALHPGYTGEDNAYEKLAAVYQHLKQPTKESNVLKKYTQLDSDALAACLRLLELEMSAGDWASAADTARRVLQINPLIPQPHRALAQAAVELDRPDEAIVAYETLLLMQPADPADVHYRLARLLHQQGDGAAKRHVLSALEEAPRFRAAHRLLLDIVRPQE